MTGSKEVHINGTKKNLPTLSSLYSPDQKKTNDYLDKSIKRNQKGKLKSINKSPRTDQIWNPMH